MRNCDPRRDEQGFAMVLVVLLISVLSILSVLLIDLVRSESGRSADAVKRQAAFQAAEAGIDSYIAKLLEDRFYYGHYVAAGESTRRPSSGSDVGPGVDGSGNPTASVWPYPTDYTYPTPKNNWVDLPNGYSYNLQISPPSSTTNTAVRIVATGKPTSGTSLSETRVIEAVVRPSSIADFQMIANRDISYGPTATTRGKLYAGRDEFGVNHSVNHDGTAYMDIYAEGSITGSVTMISPAKKYTPSTSPSIRTVIKNPIDFNGFLASLSDIQRAAATNTPSLSLDYPSATAVKIVFQPDGTFTVRTCSTGNNDSASSSNIAATQPTCNGIPTPSTYTVPANGAIYVSQSAIVSGTVKGRVTVASNANVVIGGNICYVSDPDCDGDDDTSPGTNVLGLIARNWMYVANWAGVNLSWRAGTIAQEEQWRSFSCPSNGPNNTMTFTGSTATNKGGCMTQWDFRNYNYDSTLLYLPPPWFPVLEDAYTIVLFRELQASGA